MCVYCEVWRKFIYLVKDPYFLINFIWINFYDINSLIFFVFNFNILFPYIFILNWDFKENKIKNKIIAKNIFSVSTLPFTA